MVEEDIRTRASMRNSYTPQYLSLASDLHCLTDCHGLGNRELSDGSVNWPFMSVGITVKQECIPVECVLPTH